MNTLLILSAYLRRDWAIARSYRLAFVFEAFGQLFYVMLFFFLGRLVDRGGGPAEDQLADGYFTFAIIGWAVLLIAVSGLSYPSAKLRTEQTMGSLEALLATPASPSRLLLAGAAYDYLASVVKAAAILAIAAALFGLRLSPGLWPALAATLALVATLVLWVALGIIVAAFTVVYKRSMGILGLFEAMLALFGGVYFPVDVLPAPMRFIAQALPSTWGIQVPRTALITGEVLVGRLVLLMLAASVTLPVAFWIFSNALNRARRDGSLGQY